jgi:hypothetical protein
MASNRFTGKPMRSVLLCFTGEIPNILRS